ncbi:hypothetical protein [Benzoatithermus flavus]|jgi:hypothetical protein|uniref:Ribbon-helix-helix protein CopG domain-containing protein n=1 Tax=Benzoatithermus flavus TaxID=3108223 RepID=A0ABU8XXS1_9PROT
MASPRHPARLLERLDVKQGLVSEAERAVLGAAPSPAGRGRGRPPRHEEPVQQTTIRLTRGEWAALQAQVTRETLARGGRRYVTDIIRDAIAEYLARHG